MPQSSSPRPFRVARLLLALLLLPVIAAALWWFFIRADTTDERESNAAASAPPGGAPAVSAVVVSLGDFPVTVSALGTVRSLASVEIRPRIEGELVAVEFQEGDRVEAGEVLVRLDDRTHQAQLAQANAELVQRQAQLESARADLERFQRLAGNSNVSRQELESQRQLVHQYEGAVESARASVENARVQLDYTVIRAPGDGLIGLRNIDPGNLVGPGDDDPIATFTALDPISVIFSLPSHYLPPLRTLLASERAAGVDIVSADGERTLAEGELESIDSLIDASTGTLRLRAGLPNEAGTLYPNAFVNVELTLETLDDVLLVPEVAIQHSDDGNHLYVVDESGTVSRRAVRVSHASDLEAVVTKGLQAGERVVVDGTDRLRDGARVRVVSAALPGEPHRPPQTPRETAATASAGQSGADADTPVKQAPDNEALENSSSDTRP